MFKVEFGQSKVNIDLKLSSSTLSLDPDTSLLQPENGWGATRESHATSIHLIISAVPELDGTCRKWALCLFKVRLGLRAVNMDLRMYTAKSTYV